MNRVLLAAASFMISGTSHALTIAETASYTVRSGTQIFATQFKPDDASYILVAAGRNFSQISYQPIQQTWSVDSQNPYAFMGVAYSPSGALAAAGGYGALVIYDAVTARALKTFPVSDAADFVDSIAFSNDGLRMFSGALYRGRIAAIDTETWSEVQSFACPEDCGITAVKQSDDGLRLHASTPTRLYSWSFLSGALLSTIETAFTGESKQFQFTSNGEFVFVADGARSVSHFDVETGALQRTFSLPRPLETVSFALDPTMAHVVMLSTDGRPEDHADFVLSVFDVLTGALEQSLRIRNRLRPQDLTEIPRRISFSSDGRLLQWSTSQRILVHAVQ